MEVTLARFLISDSGQLAVANAEVLVRDRVEAISGITRLRKTLDADQARAVWKLAKLRSRASDKLGRDFAKEILTDQDGYEMSSGASPASYHARQLAQSGVRTVIDLCAGVGIDTLAFARENMVVTAYEADPARALLLAENVRLASLTDRVTVFNEDVTTASLPKADAAYFDPARRSGRQKWASNEEQTVPPLSFIREVQSNGINDILVKLSPAVNRDVVLSYPGQLTFLSYRGECKEALLRIGPCGSCAGTTAVLLPHEDIFSGDPIVNISSAHGTFIWEPDPAVIRAGLTGTLAQKLAGWQCDPHNDYFFTNHDSGGSPFATCYRVLAEIPYSRRGLQEALVGSNRVVLKQRGFPQSIDDVLLKIKLPPGKKETTVILAGFSGESFAFIVERLSDAHFKGVIQ